MKREENNSFTLFNLYKARSAQIDGVSITNEAVLDMMCRFAANKRVKDVHIYPWSSFRDPLMYIDLKEDMNNDPLLDLFVRSSLIKD